NLRGQAVPQLQTFVDALARMRRNEDVSFDRGTPEGLVRDFFRTVLTICSTDAVAGFFAPDFIGTETALAESMGTLRQLMRSVSGNPLTPDVLADLSLAMVEV